jgi:hypothetical protein
MSEDLYAGVIVYIVDYFIDSLVQRRKPHFDETYRPSVGC